MKNAVFLFLVIFSVDSYSQAPPSPANFTSYDSHVCFESGSTANVMWTWEESPGATSYEYEFHWEHEGKVTSVDSFSTMMLKASFLPNPGVDFGIVTAQVRACIGQVCSPWTDLEMVQVYHDPEIPSKPGGASITDPNMNYSVTAPPTEGAGLYLWTIYPVTYTVVSGEYTNSLIIQLHEENTEYQFRVKVSNYECGMGDYSDWHFVNTR